MAKNQNCNLNLSELQENTNRQLNKIRKKIHIQNTYTKGQHETENIKEPNRNFGAEEHND